MKPPILPDLLQPGLKLVICGSAVGTVSARKGAYYAGPGNKFWPILAETGLTPRQLRPDEFPLLPSFGIGLTDLAKSAFGADTAIPQGEYDPPGLMARIRACRPAVLAFNGKKAAARFLGVSTVGYGPATEIADFPPVFVLPSTSGAASGHWASQWWFQLALLVHRLASDQAAASPGQTQTSAMPSPRTAIPPSSIAE